MSSQLVSPITARVNAAEKRYGLTPVQSRVFALMAYRPEGACRRDFVTYADIYEVSARIGEMQAKGVAISTTDRCDKHRHRHRFTLYKLVDA